MNTTYNFLDLTAKGRDENPDATQDSCGQICYDLSGKELWRFEMPPAAGDLEISVAAFHQSSSMARSFSSGIRSF